MFKQAQNWLKLKLFLSCWVNVKGGDKSGKERGKAKDGEIKGERMRRDVKRIEWEERGGRERKVTPDF